MTTALKAICIFCGAKPGNDPAYLAIARDAGATLARRGMTLVYGGGHVGMMGAVADGALAAGGEVIGVIPQRLVDREQGHRGITRLEIVSDMAVRKTRMIALSDAFVCLPGGLGTLDELFEVMTLKQIGTHDKPIGLANHGGYFDPLLRTLDAWVDAGFIGRRETDALHSAPDFDGLLDAMQRG